ncbi:ion transporter [Salibacterium salarium]|uniref:Ion transporter n=1 Tax=Salibacterium salarium TaxID=284579 RepID=A0A3R9QIF8_9BACI|nr:ion transporter [Salibacterium salarium]RSL31130.1 ion transporter [Salibacterium salarium]
MNSNSAENWRDKISRLVEHRLFIHSVMIIILINAAIVGLETFQGIYQNNQSFFYMADRILLWIFTIEIALRIVGSKPLYSFFRGPWNWFDFLIVISGFIFTGAHFVTVLRVLRVLRILRAISFIPSLRRLVDALLMTIPALGNIMILMGIIFYIYAVIGTILYQHIAPEYFGSLGDSLLTLFQVVTLESWASNVMRPLLETSPSAWIYFVSFVLVGTFVIFNLFIGVIVNNVEKVDEMGMEQDSTHVSEKSSENKNEVKELRKEVQELKELLLDEKKHRSK